MAWFYLSSLEYVTSGVAFHHAGLDLSDRSSLESLFARGDLPVLSESSLVAVRGVV